MFVLLELFHYRRLDDKWPAHGNIVYPFIANDILDISQLMDPTDDNDRNTDVLLYLHRGVHVIVEQRSVGFHGKFHHNRCKKFDR